MLSTVPTHRLPINHGNHRQSPHIRPLTNYPYSGGFPSSPPAFSSSTRSGMDVPTARFLPEPNVRSGRPLSPLLPLPSMTCAGLASSSATSSYGGGASSPPSSSPLPSRLCPCPPKTFLHPRPPPPAAQRLFPLQPSRSRARASCPP